MVVLGGGGVLMSDVPLLAPLISIHSPGPWSAPRSRTNGRVEGSVGGSARTCIGASAIAAISKGKEGWMFLENSTNPSLPFDFLDGPAGMQRFNIRNFRRTT